MTNVIPDLRAARERADIGIERAAIAAERLNAGWCELACEALRRFAVDEPDAWTIELARLRIEKSLPVPSDLRAWGKAVRMAAARGYIERVPGRFFAAASSHGSPKPVWRKGARA